MHQANISSTSNWPKNPHLSLAEAWAKACGIVAAMDSVDAEYPAELHRELDGLEDYVSFGPIESHADAIAKLRALEMSFVRGRRVDGREEEILDRVLRWFDDHRAPPLG